jgi:hypothetical protein
MTSNTTLTKNGLSDKHAGPGQAGCLSVCLCFGNRGGAQNVGHNGPTRKTLPQQCLLGGGIGGLLLECRLACLSQSTLARKVAYVAITTGYSYFADILGSRRDKQFRRL